MVYVISDLHGYPHDAFLKLLERAGFSDTDFLYILGDVIDRNGDGGVRTLVWLLSRANVQLILGNHEAMLLSCRFLFDEITEDSIDALSAEKMQFLNTWLTNGAEPTLNALKSLPEDLRENILDYLEEAPLYDAVTAGGKDYLLVHAGLENFRPDKKLSEYTADELIWASPALSDRYFPDIHTVFGHRPTFSYGEEYRGRIIKTGTWTNIDAGAGFGEKPVLYRLDDEKEFV